MDDRRNSDPILDTTSLAEPSHRASGSLQRSSTGESDQIGPSRSSSRRHSTHEDLVKSLKQQLSAAKSKVQRQELRAADTKEQISALISHLKVVNDARVAAVQEAATASEELRLYKIALEKARQELRRAQGIIDTIEKERHDAVEAATEARTLARRYGRDLLVMKAMDEGRRLGMQEGFKQGRALALRETDTYEDMDDESYANEYMDYAEADLRPRSLHVASNEEIVVHPSQSLNIESVPQPPQPVPVPPPEVVQPMPAPSPLSIRSPSPSIIPQPISIPPDGYIPTIDSDNVIRMPPPHELARPPPTPEQPASPQLPEPSQEEPRPSSKSHIRRRSSSSLARAPPLSDIPEAESPYASPLVQEADLPTLRPQPSQSSDRQNVNAELRGGAGSQRAQSPSIHRRQSAGSNISGVPRPSSLNQEDRRASTVSSTILNINVVPPSSSRSSGISQHNVPNNTSLEGGGEGITNVSRPSLVSQLFGDHVIGQPGPSTFGAGENSDWTAIPGAYRDQTDQMSTREQSRPGSSTGRRPIDNDEISIRSQDTLATPRAPRRSLSRTSLDSLSTC